MADRSIQSNGNSYSLKGGANAASFPAHTVFENTIDFSETPMSASDTITDFIAIPAGSFIVQVVTEVLTAETNAAVGVLGVKGGDVDGFDTDVALNATGYTVGNGALTAATLTGASHFYDADGFVQFALSAAAAGTDGVVRVAVVVANVG